MDVNSRLLLGHSSLLLTPPNCIDQPPIVCLSRHRVAICFEGKICWRLGFSLEGCCRPVFIIRCTLRLDLESFEAQLGGVIEGCGPHHLLHYFGRLSILLL